MATTNYELWDAINNRYPQTSNSLQKLVMRMADYNKHMNKTTWWGKNKSRKAWKEFEGELNNIIIAMFLDEIIERNASTDEIRQSIYEHIIVFSTAFPNWQDAYGFAKEFFIESKDRANQVIEFVSK